MEQPPFPAPDYQPPTNPHQPRHVPHHVMPQYEHVLQPQPQAQHQQQAQPQQFHQPPAQISQSELTPQPVVQVLSPRGIEYVFLTISLFIGAFGLGWALIAMVNSQFRVAILAFPVACMLVAVPVFGWLFLRLKQAELANPALRVDPSKRRTTQLSQIVSFIVAMFAVIGLITGLTAKLAGDYNGNAARLIATTLIIFSISSGILAYYWHDEHQP